MSDRNLRQALWRAKRRVVKLEGALNLIACWNDEGANARLRERGDYSLFDEPAAVRIAREILAAVDGGESHE